MDPSPSLWNVPHQRNPYFTGREDLFDRLDQHFVPQAHPATGTRRVALTQPHAIKGLGGIGKTQIAVEGGVKSNGLSGPMGAELGQQVSDHLERLRLDRISVSLGRRHAFGSRSDIGRVRAARAHLHPSWSCPHLQV